MPGPVRGPRGRAPAGMKFKGAVKKGTFKKLLKLFFSRHRTVIILSYLAMLLTSVASAASSIFLKNATDAITNGDWNALLITVSSLAGVFAVGLLASFYQGQITAFITQGFLKDIRSNMFNKMQRLPIRYFDTHKHGDIMSAYTNDTDTLRQLISQSLPQIFSTIVTVAVMLFVMLWYSIWLTLVIFAFLAVMFLITKVVGGKSSTYFVSQQKSLGKCEGFIEEAMNGQKVIKVFTHESESKKDFDKLNNKLCSDAAKANAYSNILMPIMGNIGHFEYVMLAIVGTLLTISDIPNLSLSGKPMSLAIIIAFLPMSRQFSMSISQVSQQLNSVFMGLAGAGRIFELMEEEPEVNNGYVTLVNVEKKDGQIVECDKNTHLWAWKHPHGNGTLTYTELKGEVVFDDVDFGYTPDKVVLHNISLYALPGQKVAFVGATGAGKTTITNLINRFYDIADGKIRYDGININKINKNDLRRSLGIVLQDTNLFTGTVMDNIRYGRLDATDEECIAAAKLANADDFITRLPDGYSTMLTGDGANLSQGQRQLLSIARAAVADPPVMILDEATSSIDTRTEKLVQSGMDKLMKGRTVFVIAHRLSTVQNSDVIMVLENGRIIERGSHDELLDKKGKYYQLYTGMFELS